MALLPGMFVDVAGKASGLSGEGQYPASSPCVRRDPYGEAFRFWAVEVDTFRNNQQRWLWVPAFLARRDDRRECCCANYTRPFAPCKRERDVLHRRRGHAAIDHDGL